MLQIDVWVIFKAYELISNSLLRACPMTINRLFVMTLPSIQNFPDFTDFLADGGAII